ncbi:MAG: DNA cytosine methyltransferase [Mesorhizobium sp.]|nr:DNA cytosine methyltransferase [Mesorhizobium sp.]MCO5085128.1 DNA cytosine methyltransferase [Rhizobiaceae bacterium]MCO5164618.1 DNA cytosine methyltransferase [Mesorhizobium sp.]
MQIASAEIEFRHFHFFCGLGGGKKGFNKGSARVGNLRARFRCIGGIDNDPAAIRDFDRAGPGKGTVLDLFSREQFIAFHGHEPPAGWRLAGVDDVRRAANGERPHIIFLSAPCKGFSGLLPEKSSASAKYQALNGLTVRGVMLMLEAWSDDPPELIIFENVPRIMNRGRHLLDQIVALLRAAGYAVAETTHDCGEIGGLGQSRKRFLLVARHEAKVPPFLYEPEKRRLRGVGEILERLPLPGDVRAGPMHRMPALQWKTWVRLAFVEAGSDWRSLNKLAIEDGVLRDFGILPEVEWQGGVLGVRPWDQPSGVVTGRGSPTTGTFAVADPRFAAGGNEYSQYGVRRWSEPMGAVINVKSPGQGTFAVADPTIPGKPRFNNVFRIVPWGDAAPAVAGPGGPAGGLAVADPRPAPRDDYKQTKYRVTGFAEAAGTVIAASTTGNGAFAVADPRPGKPTEDLQGNWHITPFDEPAHAVVGNRKSGASAVADPRPVNDLRNGAHGVRAWDETSGTVAGESLPPNGAFSVADPRPEAFKEGRKHYEGGGHYGVLPWGSPSKTVYASGNLDNGYMSVADPRETSEEPLFELPAPNDRLVAVIRALDGTWHRPFTTLELAALQSLVDPEDIAAGFALDGQSDSAWRERIGNAVPPDAAAAIADVMGTTLLLAMTGETFMLSTQPIWVQPIAMALAVDQRGNIPWEAAE